MLVPFLFAASLLFPGPTCLPSGSVKPCLQPRDRRRVAAVTAVKENVQFVTLPPSPHPLPTLKATLPFDAPAQVEREEQDLISAINAERAQRGLLTLQADPLLTETARFHSREMCDRAYFDHNSPLPGLTTPMDRYLSALRVWGELPPESAIVGENIFYCSATSDFYNGSYAHKSLMASPGHRANILEPRFTKVGVGLYRDSQGRFWVTEMFLRDTDMPQ